MKGPRVVIEMGQRSIKMFQTRMDKDELSLSYFDAEEVGAATEEALGSVLAGMVAAKKNLKENVVAVLPRWCALFRQLSLPAQDEEELRKIVVLHLGQVGPFSREDVQYDFMVLGQDEAGYSRVLLVVVPRDAIDRLLRIFKKARVDCRKIVLSSFGVRNWLRYQESTGGVEAEENVLLIDLGRDDSEICFIEKGDLAFSRSIPCGTVGLNQGGPGPFLEQVALTCDAHKTEHRGSPPSKIVIFSNGGQGQVLQAALRKSYSVPIVVLDCLRGMSCRVKVPSRVSAMTTGASLAALAGFSMGGEADGVDLLPAEVVDQARSKLRKKTVFHFIAAFMLCLVLAAGRWGVDILQKQAYLDQINQQLAQNKKKAQKSRNMMRAQEFILNQRQNRVLVADVIKELYQLSPDSISFRSIHLRQNASFEMEGYADNQAAVNELQSSLVSSSLFKGVTLQYATKRKRAGEEFTAFKISCRLRESGGSDGG